MNNFPTHINTYAGGLDKDTSVNKYSNTHYQHAENFRILTENGLTSGALQTVAGTTKLFNIETNYTYHGHCFIRDWVVMFLRHTGAADQIYYFPFDNPIIAGQVLDVGYKVWEGDLNFQSNYMVQAEGRYESVTTQKVYWVDGYNNIRFANLVEVGLSAKPVTYFDVLPVFNQNNISIDEITNDGILKAGLISYATIFYTPKGAETIFSQPSSQIQITNGLLTSNFENIIGLESGENSDKAIILTITNPDSSIFNRVKLISIHYQEHSSNPIITIVGEYSINSSITVRDGGNSFIGEYSPEEFNRLKNIFSATTLSTKNNYLFAGNITEEYTSIDYDSRAYRFNELNTSHVEGSQAHVTIDTTDIITDPINWTVPEIHDATNAFNDLTSDTTNIEGTAYDYRYKLGLLTEWINVDYDAGFTSTGANISVAVNAAGTASAVSNAFELEEGDVITLKTFLTRNAGQAPNIDLMLGAVVDTATTLLNGNNVLSYIINTTGTYHFKLHNTASCDIELSSTKLLMFGGSGPSISYKFKVGSFIEDEAINTNNIGTIDIDGTIDDLYIQRYKGPSISVDPDLKGTYDNYLSPYRRIQSLSFRRDEIYRVGIEWFDNYGRPISVNWIGDIRFPSNKETNYGFVTVDYGAETVSMHPLTLRVDVTVTQELIDNNISGFRIVRCDRTEENKTVLDSGLVGSMQPHADSLADSYNFPYEQVAGKLGQAYDVGGFIDLNDDEAGHILNFDLVDQYKEYTSAEINYNKNNISFNNTYLSPQYEMDAYYSIVRANVANAANTKIVAKKYTILDQTSFAFTGLFDVNETILFSDSTYEASIDVTAYYKELAGNKMYNYSQGSRSNTPDSDNDNARGTCLVLNGTLVNAVNNPYDAAAKLMHAVYSNRKRNIIPYGGNSYYDRINSSYIACSPYYDISAQALNAVVKAEAIGDTYLFMHEHLRTMISQKPGNDDNMCIEVVLYPTESSFNGSLRIGTPLYKMLSGWSTDSLGVHEELGVYTLNSVATPGEYGGTFTQTFGYYDYNKVYNTADTLKQYLPEPLDFDVTNNQIYDNKVIASEKKFNNELIDSWTQFYFANEIELDSKYGSITKLINFNNSLLSFQSKAIAALSVEEKEVAQTNTPTALAIGYSGVLSRYDYLSTDNGTSQIKAIIQTPNQVMWYDNINNGIYSLKGLGEPSISKIKGVNSWFNSTVINPNYTTSCITGYDRKFNEVLFQFQYYTSSNYTLVFNEITNSFTSLYSLPRLSGFIFSKSRLLGIQATDIDTLVDSVHEHNADTSSLYDSYPIAKLSLIVKPQDSGMIRFDSLEWNTILKTFAGVETQLTFDRIRCSNSYQDSQLIITPDFKRRFREWRYNTIRDFGTSARLRDSYMKIDFEYDIESNNYLLVHDIKTHYLPNKS